VDAAKRQRRFVGRGEAAGVTDRTLLVSGDACARACASVTGVCAPRARPAHTRTAATTSRNRPTATASITGSDIRTLRRF
jgi:hypothetical protein